MSENKWDVCGSVPQERCFRSKCSLFEGIQWCSESRLPREGEEVLLIRMMPVRMKSRCRYSASVTSNRYDVALQQCAERLRNA